MSLLEQQMRELQMRQRKVEFLKNLIGLVAPQPIKENEMVPDFVAQAEQEISSEVQEFLKAKIDQIENGTPAPSQEGLPQQSEFTQEEVGFLKEMCARAGERGITANNNVYADEEEEAPAPNPMERRRQNPGPRPRPPQQAPAKPKGQKDLVIFARENAHMHGKRVTVNAKQGRVGGVVTGVSSPGFLMVTTDTGHDVPVAIENITLE
jgi:hypothetical protein